MNNRIKLILDCDNTIISSTKAFYESYQLLYKNHPDFVEADWNTCNKYNLSDICPLQSQNPREIFDSKLFFELVKPFDNAVEVLKTLSKQFDIYLCTIGSSQNIQNKLAYIEKTFPFIENILPIINNHTTMDKSIINMSGNCIFVDDVASNLFSSNATTKICYGEIKPWNEEWKGKRCKDMIDLYNQVIFIAHGQNGLHNDVLNHNLLATYNKINSNIK